MEDYNAVSIEDILIEAVRQRPSIYDKSRAAYKNSKIRDHEWREVAKAVNTQDVEAVKKRWRSLRDSFIKLHRSLRHNPRQVIKWLYYKRLLFLVPHIESRESGSDTIKNEEDDTTQETSHTDSEIETNPDFRFVPEDVNFSDTPSQNRVEFSGSSSSNKRKRKTIIEEDPLTTNDEFLAPIKDPDPDEQFLLSCLPALKRLQPRENAIARMRIQQVLFEIEFGEEQQSSDILRTKVESDDAF